MATSKLGLQRDVDVVATLYQEVSRPNFPLSRPHTLLRDTAWCCVMMRDGKGSRESERIPLTLTLNLMLTHFNLAFTLATLLSLTPLPTLPIKI
jgi:hypothetical protein